MPRRGRGIIWRDGWAYLWVPGRVGRAKRACGTRSPTTARHMAAIVQRLRDERAWELLEAVRDGRCTLGELFDADAMGERGREALRATLADVELRPLLERFLATFRADGGAESTATLYAQQVGRWLDAHPRRSDLTRANVAAWLTSLEVSSGTRRGYLYALRAFVGYLVTANVLTLDPLAGYKAPAPNAARTRHEDEATDRRIADAAPAPYRALFAFIHATGAEVSAALAARRRDLDLEEGVARVRGTKTALRDRPASLLEEWALPILTEHVRGLLPDALLWPGISRQQAYNHHQAACRAARVTDYTLRDARHSWCIRALERGATFHDLAVQLGHRDTSMVHRVYARFLPQLDGRLSRYRREAIGPTAGPAPARAVGDGTSAGGLSGDAAKQSGHPGKGGRMGGTRLELKGDA